jgi:hypothetical protein
MDDGRVREKRFVLLAVDETTVTCVINSRINDFIKHRPDLLRCQVVMPRSAHPFMDHDSHVDCSRTRSYATADVVRDLAAGPEWILGSVSPELREEIVAALKCAPTLAPSEVAFLVRALEDAQS